MAYKFLEDDGMNFEVQNILGHARVGGSDPGEVLSTALRVTDGDDASWVREWEATAARVAAIADTCAADGHDASAAEAYLRAAVYYAAAVTSADGLPEPDATITRLFGAHRRCFDAYLTRAQPPGEKITIPYEGTEMPGYFVSSGSGRRPTIILNNGSDGAVTSMIPGVSHAALARGYNVVTFDGPGQQSMLFERGVPFRPDWEHVITPVVDALVARADVDPDRIALYGISQAGYWVPRALVFEHRIAAAIADPGVVDVSTSWLEHLPKEMIAMLDSGDKKTFEQFMEIGMASAPPQQKQEIAWRAKPYGKASVFDVYKAVEQYRLSDEEIAQITTPLFVTDPDGEQFWPGQSRTLYDKLRAPKAIAKFTAAEGADRHCQPMGRALTDQRMFDWLDGTLATPRSSS
jgi:hypothetical protein